MSESPVFLFDACAIVAVLLGEVGGVSAGKLLSDGHDCRVTPVIVSEAVYVLLRVGADAEELRRDVDRMGLKSAEVAMECGFLAAGLRHRYAGLSTADALHLATAQHNAWVLVSSDGPLLLASRNDGIPTTSFRTRPGSSGRPPTP